MKLPDLSSFWKSRKPDRLGLDMDAHSVRVVNLKARGESKFNVVACGSLNVSSKKLTISEEQRLAAFLKQMGAGVNKVALSIEDPSLRIRRMSFPKLPERDLIEAIKWNFREHVDVPIEEYLVGYTPITGWQEGDQFSYSAYGVTRKSVEEHIVQAEKLGVKTVAVEPKASALLAAINSSISWEAKQTVVAVLLEEGSAHFTVMSEGELLFSRPMPSISFDMMIRFLSREMVIEEQLAEEVLKKSIAEGKLKFTEEEAKGDAELLKLSVAVKAFYTQLIIEVQRSIDAFCLMYNLDRVDRIFLCGKGAYCPEIVEHMNKSLGVQTAIFNPFSNIEESQLSEQVRSRGAVFAVAFGLAIPQ